MAYEIVTYDENGSPISRQRLATLAGFDWRDVDIYCDASDARLIDARTRVIIEVHETRPIAPGGVL